MIKVQELKNTDGDPNSYKIFAFADTKEEVEQGGIFEGLPKGAAIELGSTILTAKGELGFMQSNGTWNWLSNSGGGGGQGGGDIIVVTNFDEVPEPSEELVGKVCLVAWGVALDAVVGPGTVANMAVWMTCIATVSSSYVWIPLPGSGMPELNPMFHYDNLSDISGYPACSVELTTMNVDAIFQRGHKYQRIPVVLDDGGMPLEYGWMDTEVANDGDANNRPDEFPKLVGVSVGHLGEGDLARIDLRFSKFITTELDDQLTMSDNITAKLRCADSYVDRLLGGFMDSLPHFIDGEELVWVAKLNVVMLNSANVTLYDDQTQLNITKPIAMTDVSAYIENETGDISQISDSGVELHIDRTTHDYDYAIFSGTVEFIISLVAGSGK